MSDRKPEAFARLLAFLRALLGIPGPWRFADLEVFGHRKHFARVREIGWLGARFLEVRDLETTWPADPIRYGAGAIFSCRWVSDEDSERRIESYQRRQAALADDRKRWAEEEARREAMEQRSAILRAAVVEGIEKGFTARDALMAYLSGWSGDGAEGAPVSFTGAEEVASTIDRCLDRGEIVEDPRGGGIYRLPTQEEMDDIPW